MTMLPKPGDRIRLLAMPDDPDPIPSGEVGTVIEVTCHGDGKNAWHQVDVERDNRRNLMLTLPPDRIEILRNTTGIQDSNCRRIDCGIHYVYPAKGASDMEKALIKHGNSLAIVIDKPVLDLLQITADTKIELTTNGDAIMLTPVRDKKRQARLQAALQKINNQFGDDLRKLAE